MKIVLLDNLLVGCKRHKAGEEIELPETEAMNLVKGNLAVVGVGEVPEATETVEEVKPVRRGRAKKVTQ